MAYDNDKIVQLLERIEELELLNRELLAEKEQEIRLEYAWTGNLGHWYWNIKTNTVTFNPLKVTMLGYDKSEIPEHVTFQYFTDKLHPDDLQKTMDAMRDHLHGKASAYEFMVVFSNADLATASGIAQRIRKSIENRVLDEDIRITISGGVKQYQGESLTDLIHAADIHLYEAKGKGKNSIVS